jgi:hypothetical protein
MCVSARDEAHHAHHTNFFREKTPAKKMTGSRNHNHAETRMNTASANDPGIAYRIQNTPSPLNVVPQDPKSLLTQLAVVTTKRAELMFFTSHKNQIPRQFIHSATADRKGVTNDGR